MGKRLSYNYVKNYIESFGYTLLSDTYKNVHIKLKLECDKGHEYESNFNNFKKGNRCPVCAGKKKHTYNEVRQYIENQDYTLLSDTYNNAHTKLKVRCDKGHEYEVSFANFQQGYRCPVCAGNVKLTYNYVKQYIEKEGYTLLSNAYKNAFNKLKIKCPKGHEYEVKFNNFQQGQRCPLCFNETMSSKAEKELAEFIKALLYDKNVLINDRTQIINPLTGKNLEHDIFVPELKIAIEYNGTYWHSLENAVRNDKIKREQCKEKSINLLIVKEGKWIENKQLEMMKIEKWIKGYHEI